MFKLIKIFLCSIGFSLILNAQTTISPKKKIVYSKEVKNWMYGRNVPNEFKSCKKDSDCKIKQTHCNIFQALNAKGFKKIPVGVWFECAPTFPKSVKCTEKICSLIYQK